MTMYTREQTTTDVQDDPKAREMLEAAFEKTARWQPDFKGFQADLRINVNGKETKGTVTVKGPRDVSVVIDDPELQTWAQNQIGMIAVHRGPRNFKESDGKYTVKAAWGMLRLICVIRVPVIRYQDSIPST